LLRKQYDNPHTHTRTHGALDIHGQSYHIAVLYMVSPTTNPVSTYAGSRFILGKIRCPRLEVDTGGDDMNGAVLVRARVHISRIMEKLGGTKAEAVRDSIRHYGEYLEGLEVVNLRDLT